MTKLTDATHILERAIVSGTSASVVSTIALACAGHFDSRSAYAPTNAISHWIWGDRALHVDRPAPRYTAVGYVIHHATSVFWAAFYEAWVERSPRSRQPMAVLTAGLGMAALACFVDLKCTPQRLTPGFERRLSGGPLALVYVAFGLGLALTTLWRNRREQRDQRESARPQPDDGTVLHEANEPA
ncbi:hypothetical protein CURE108131_08670 [Cupriavidus respiraculi]|uniref:DUF2938 domain-containing protein n=1 Tax=Cupriavidus respiraculi TaxID=195930 RepID=A0ABN7Y553_9BURK|nr:hypothetical protein [Cupriavidus respiraculi]CAG9168463.1 hypothetical protein LMG21510_01083 [Cupriavidus respiraculi]